MVFADHFDEADVLDTLAWVMLTLEARSARLAALYLDNETDVEYAHRNYEGPTLGIVRVFVKSIYDPPRGQGGITYQRVLQEIPKQRKVREERSKYKPWTFKVRKIQKRRNRIAKRLYTVWKKCRWNNKEKEKQTNNCIAISRLGGCKLVVDGGSYYHKARIYIRHLATGKVKVVVLKGSENKVYTLGEALMRMAPKAAVRGMFDGVPITLDFKGGGFLVNGEVVVWRAVKTYPGSKAHKTWDHDA